MLYSVRWSVQGRICYVYSGSAVDAELAAGAISERFQCEVLVYSGSAAPVARFSNGQRQPE